MVITEILDVFLGVFIDSFALSGKISPHSPFFGEAIK
jgi:hypothetical protein